MYARTFIKYWGAWMSGLASVIFTAWVLFFEPRSETVKQAFTLLAVVAAVATFIQLWAIEHNKYLTEKAKNAYPEIKGELLEVYFREAFGQGGKHPHYIDYYITLNVHLVNIRQVSTTIKEFRLKVETNAGEFYARINRWKQGDLALRKEEKRYGFFNLPVSNNETLTVDLPSIESPNALPLNYGEGRTGWLNFFVPEMSPDQIKEVRRLTLIVVDAFGASHEITASPSWKGIGKILNRNEEEYWLKIEAEGKAAKETEKAEES
jgi:hypothetical protein